jgi:hypothetical protein
MVIFHFHVFGGQLDGIYFPVGMKLRMGLVPRCKRKVRMGSFLCIVGQEGSS